MRITGGEFRGRTLQAPKGEMVRPTSDRTRQAVFNILTAGRWRSAEDWDVVDSQVMDVFCGTGALGLEALSRGAQNCIFIDNDKTSLAFARKNAEVLNLNERAQFTLREAAKIGPRQTSIRQANLVFLDPPYRKNLVAPALAALVEGDWLLPAAIIMVETESNIAADEFSDLPFDCLDMRTYGDTLVRILRFRG
jgi:16S rRNA (guanine966-N2)-methyltransferase